MTAVFKHAENLVPYNPASMKKSVVRFCPPKIDTTCICCSC